MSTTKTVPLYRLETHSRLPSGDTWSMSGLPPTVHVATTRRSSKLTTEIVPASRLLT